MTDGIDIFKKTSLSGSAGDAYREKKNLSVFGLSGIGKYAFAASLPKTLVVTHDYFSAGKFYEGIKTLCPRAVLLSSKGDVLTYHKSVAGGGQDDRFAALSCMARGAFDVVVTSVQGIMELYPLRERFLAASLDFAVGGSYDLSGVPQKLVAAGYTRAESAAEIGQFSLRGDILEVWQPGSKYPLRLEFFGDDLEVIKLIDPAEQSVVEKTDAVHLSAFTDLFLSEAEAQAAINAMLADKPAKLEGDSAARLDDIIGDAAGRLLGGDRGAALNLFLPYIKTCSLFEFGGFSSVVYDGAKQVYDAMTEAEKEHASRFSALLTRGECLPAAFNQLIPLAQLSTGAFKVAFQSIENANRLFNPDRVLTFKMMEHLSYARDFNLLKRDLAAWRSTGYRIVFAAGKDIGVSVGQLLDEIGLPRGASPDAPVFVSDVKIENGAVFHDDKLVVLGAYDLSLRPVKKQLRRHKSDVFSELKPGDYVVHEIHGVGHFERVTELKIGDVRRDYLEIRYAGTDKLYVPVENMEALMRFDAETPPALSKIGGAAFAKVKARVKSAVKELAFSLYDLYRERFESRGHQYSADDSFLNEFEKTCGFVETEDQLAAVHDGLDDLKSGKIMDRLLCGDVGYGKTEVALRLAFKVIAEGKQVAFLSPTTILAEQHFNTVKRRMEPFGIKVARLTRFDSAADIKKSIAALKEGKVDIAVGTHRMLSKDVDFLDLGLLILDEEQRFGVADKEKIKNMRRRVNVLALSATPIPRTLHMSLTGIRDISILDTPPVDRLPVKTYVSEYGEALVTDAVQREIYRGGQVFIVYNRVEKLPRYAARLKALMPELKLTVAHGQMEERALERAVKEFVSGETDVLLSSTIVENGIDIARANTMIVLDADRLGLSQLYQLRGRVGRSNRTAYVFFTYESGKILNENAVKRLEAVLENTELGSGFRIAMRDLEIRGAGSIMGAEQHGHMEKVGYDMYVRLLKEAVAELKGETVAPVREIKISTDFSTFIPDGYIGAEKERLKTYARIARVADLKERDSLSAQLTELYGEPPHEVKNLIDTALLKNLAAKVSASTLAVKKSGCAIGFDKLIDIPQFAHELALKEGGKLNLEPPQLVFKSGGQLLKFLLKAVQKTSR